MTLVINTNIASIAAQRHLESSRGSLETAMERLSSGRRINSSKDDAAGLAIGERMTAQVNGLNQAVRNANDAISYAQTAEGALDETSSILQRMRELAVQAANDTYSAADRIALQAEVNLLTQELDRISETSKFNGVSLLDGSGGVKTFQVGAFEGETLDIFIPSASASELNLSVGSSTANGDIVSGRITSAVGVATDDISINDVDWAASLTESSEIAGGIAATTEFSVATAYGIARAINTNTESHGVTAKAFNSYTGGIAGGVVQANTLRIGIDNSTAMSYIGASSNAEELVANINRDAAGVTATLNSDGTITLSNTTGKDIYISAESGQTSNTGFVADTYTGYVAMNSADGSPIKIGRGDNSGSTVADIQKLGVNATTNGASVVTGKAITETALSATMDMTLNGVQIPPTDLPDGLKVSASDLATTINQVTSQTDVNATAYTQAIMQVEMAAGSATDSKVTAESTFVINGVDVTVSAGSTVAQITGGINDALGDANSGGVVASYLGSEVYLTSDAGLTISVTDATASSVFTTINNQDGSEITDSLTHTAAASITGSLTLTNTIGGEVVLSTDAGTTSDTETNLGYLGLQRNDGAGQSVGGSAGVDITEADSAAHAITKLDQAIAEILASRGELGAFQNRLDHTVSNLTNVAENLSAARSRIVDADFAIESANLAKSQVLQQAGTAMLAQANAMGQNVLSLLK